MLKAGQIIGTWELGRQLGEGTFGEVWRARHTDLGVERALKIPTDAEFVRQLRMEGRLQFNLRHPRIVEVFELNTRHDPPYLAMELVEGGSLRQALCARGPLPLAEAMGILEQVLEAAAFAHAQGVLHRDLKPENILLATDGTVKVTDFGLGKVQEQIARSLVLSGSMSTVDGHSISGTIAYMSPEQQEGVPPAPQDDVYALGILGCEMLLGKRPGLTGIAKALGKVGTPPELIRFLEQACEDRDSRYPDAGAMRGAMREALAAIRHPKPQASRPSPSPRAAEPSPRAERPSSGGMAWRAGLVAVLVLVLGGILWFSIGQGTRDSTPSAAPPPAEIPKVAEATETRASPAKPAPPTIAPGRPEAGQSFTNSLGMCFVPAGTDRVLFDVWETRVRDYRAFVEASGHSSEGGMWSLASKAREGTDGKNGNDYWQQRGHSWKDPGFAQSPDHPVVGVSWNDAKAFCEWLTRKERAEGRIGSSDEYRLPTDEEWSRAVGTSKYPWGESWPPSRDAGNYAGSEARDENWPSVFPTIEGFKDGFARTSPSGSFRANTHGLFDMGGNVWEWCEDWYRKEMNTDEARKSVPALENDGGGSTFKVVRGGSWYYNAPANLASSYRGYDHPAIRVGFYGFRCVLAVRSSR